MTRLQAGHVASGVTVFAVAALLGEQLNGRPHLAIAGTAVSLVTLAAVAAGFAEQALGRHGGEALVAAYWAGVGARGLVTLVGGMLVGRFGFELQDRRALVLWVLAAYLAALVVETVRAVRTADELRLAKSGRAGGANE